MHLVISHLEKELERQNLLIEANKIDKQIYVDNPIYQAVAPIDYIYPNMEQFRDELEHAIAILKTK